MEGADIVPDHRIPLGVDDTDVRAKRALCCPPTASDKASRQRVERARLNLLALLGVERAIEIGFQVLHKLPHECGDIDWTVAVAAKPVTYASKEEMALPSSWPCNDQHPGTISRSYGGSV